MNSTHVYKPRSNTLIPALSVSCPPSLCLSGLQMVPVSSQTAQIMCCVCIISRPSSTAAAGICSQRWSASYPNQHHYLYFGHCYIWSWSLINPSALMIEKSMPTLEFYFISRLSLQGWRMQSRAHAHVGVLNLQIESQECVSESASYPISVAS